MNITSITSKTFHTMRVQQLSDYLRVDCVKIIEAALTAKTAPGPVAFTVNWDWNGHPDVTRPIMEAYERQGWTFDIKSPYDQRDYSTTLTIS
jgi:hypothetical protein